MVLVLPPFYRDKGGVKTRPPPKAPRTPRVSSLAPPSTAAAAGCLVWRGLLDYPRTLRTKVRGGATLALRQAQCGPDILNIHYSVRPRARRGAAPPAAADLVDAEKITTEVVNQVESNNTITDPVYSLCEQCNHLKISPLKMKPFNSGTVFSASLTIPRHL